jgi:hypothetical protein
MLEVKIPKEILKTPKAMEQIFAELYASYSYGMTFVVKYLEGRVEPWFVFELVGSVAGVHFYIRVPAKFRNLVESAIYAQYPAAEIYQVDDYVELLPLVLPNKIYDVWGADLILAKESYYPIRTYSYFEETQEEKRLDPIAAITEVTSNLKEGEMILIQVLISSTGVPSGNNWQAEGLKKIEEIAGRKTAEKKGLGTILADWLRNLIWAPIEHPTWPEAAKITESPAIRLHSAEQDIIKAIANKISKLGFETIIRLVYLDKRDSFSPANPAAVMGAIHQFNMPNLNSFKIHPQSRSWIGVSWLVKIFPKYKELKELYRKRRIFRYYQTRRFGCFNKTRNEKFPIFNTEELATIYHFPAIMVEAPKLRRLEAKKGEPPLELPIE